MSEQAKTGTLCGEYSRGAPWYPLRKWWHLSQLFSEDGGLESGEAGWTDVDWLQRSSWPGCVPAPLFVPYISGSMHQPSQKISKWRVIMDVAHFSPSEISLSVRDGFLEVGGKHEERPDQHGFIARCFTRKYRLPVEADATKITSALSPDGLLTVEAPVPETSAPAAIPIPINVVVLEDNGESEVKDEKEEASDKEAEFASSEDHGEGSSLDPHSDEGQPGSAPVGLQQHEERREMEEETHEKSAGECHPSVPVGDESTESLQESSMSRETQESQESPDVDASKQLDLQGSGVDEELQVMAGSREAAEDITQEQVQSQDLEAANIKQEHAQ